MIVLIQLYLNDVVEMAKKRLATVTKRRTIML